VKLLLDTHIWLWSLLDPSKLVRRVARALEAAENEVWLSPISSWEVLVLVEKGRVVLEKDPVRWLADVWKALPLREAPLTHEVAVQSRLLELPHQDPADRFLGATAKVYGLTLVTADDRLLHSNQFATLANR